MPLSRRQLLQMLSSSTFFLTVGSPLARAQGLPTGDGGVTFPHGVASGDPQPDAVMLWTRAEPADGTAAVTVQLQVSADEAFDNILLRSNLETGADSDFTLRAYVDGLSPDRWYYYRFVTASESSRIGRTRTAPSPDQARDARVAFVSCQSYEQAYYGGWARMIADDEAAAEDERIDFVLHMGDFIYERCWNKRIDGSAQSRRVPDFPDGVDTEHNRYARTLADYRLLYKTYLADPHLQAARARWPFICTWDDHEYSNDNFQATSTYYGELIDDPQRKLEANQAWFEYIPAVLDELADQPAHDFTAPDGAPDSASAVDSLCIYRRLRWGKLVDIVLTDGRSYRSGPCLPDGLSASLGLPLDTVLLVDIADGGREYDGGNPPDTLPYGDGTVANPAKDRAPGTMLGDAQREWFLDTLQASDATWKLWGNPMPLVPQRLDMASLPFMGFEDSLINIDSWAGFPHEFNLLMDELEQRQISGVVSLSGDHHLHAAATIANNRRDDAPAVVVDFAVAGISSSPVFEDVFIAANRDHPDFRPLVYADRDGGHEPVWHMSMLEGVLAAYAYSTTGSRTLASWLGPNKANRGLQYLDTTINGYGLAHFGPGAVEVELVAMRDCRQEFSEAPEKHFSAHFTVPAWQAGTAAVLEGPTFDGGAPFPFEGPKV